MIWVCRAGMKSVFLDRFLCESKIYIPWDGFKTDLNLLPTIQEIKELVRSEKGECPRTSIANWSGQLFSFCHVMKEGDYVLIPHKGSRTYTFAKITGKYEYGGESDDCLVHSRQIKIILNNIPRESFSQSLCYSLGAYRTIFRVKQEDELLNALRRVKRS